MSCQDTSQVWLHIMLVPFQNLQCVIQIFEDFEVLKQEHPSDMGRPSGSMEKKLTGGEAQQIVGASDMPAHSVSTMVTEATSSFSSAADDKVAITRQMLRDNLWILKDLVVASPTQIVHADSTLGCHTHSYFPVIKPTVDVFQSCIDTDFSEAHQEVRCGHCGVTCAQLEGTHAIPKLREGYVGM